MARRHTFTPIDRGTVHVHRWTAHCACGWFGRHHRRKDYAKREFRGHLVAAEEIAHRIAGRRRAPAPKPLTPVEKLPDALKPS